MIKHLSASDFLNCAKLTDWLLEHDINLSAWNADNAKGVDNLWHEIQRGETTLSADPVQRNVRVVELSIARGDKILTEISQELQDGRIRERQLLPSEKLHADETVEDGARRCLEEELGVAGKNVALQLATNRQHVHDSPSYPGLKTVYSIHVVFVSLPQLPDHDFTVPNQDPHDAVVAHTWGWRHKNDFCHP